MRLTVVQIDRLWQITKPRLVKLTLCASVKAARAPGLCGRSSPIRQAGNILSEVVDRARAKGNVLVQLSGDHFVAAVV